MEHKGIKKRYNNKEIFENTELELLKTTSNIVEDEGNYYYKSEKFPKFYGGNGMAIFNDTYKGNIDKYILKYKHIFQWDNTIILNFYPLVNKDKLVKNSLSRNYEVDYQEIMYLNNPTSKKQIYKIEEIKDFDLLFNFEKKISDFDWFLKEGFEKKKLITKHNKITWLGIKENHELVSCLGYFKKNKFLRLQDVETISNYYRKSYASNILSTIINQHYKNNIICLYVDSDNATAISFYKKMGFVKNKNKILTITLKKEF